MSDHTPYNFPHGNSDLAGQNKSIFCRVSDLFYGLKTLHLAFSTSHQQEFVEEEILGEQILDHKNREKLCLTKFPAIQYLHIAIFVVKKFLHIV